MKATPRKLAYVDSDKEALAGSLAKGFSDQFFLESSGTSDTPRQTRSTIKSQKTPSKNKELTHLRRSRRLEDQSTTKEKARKERSKSRRKRFEHQETSSEFEYEEGLDDACEDLNSPYKRPKPTLFTQRITRFKYHKRAKLPRNIRTRCLKGSKPSLGEKWLMGQHKWSVLLKRTKDKKDAFTPLTKTPKEILSMESISFPELSPLIETPKKQSLNKFCDYHGDRGHNINDCYQLRKQIEEVVASGKLAHLVKDIHRNNRWNGNPGRNGVKVINMIRQEGNHKRSFEERRSGRYSLDRIKKNHYSTIRYGASTKDIPLAKLVVYKRRPMASEGRLALKEKVFHWLKEGLIRKDMYPLLEEGEELASLMGYPMMEKVVADQRGRNVETYLEEIVIKSKSEMDLVQDVKEILRKLKRVNIKIDPTMSSFGVKEGRFLSHMVTEEGIRADLGKIHAIILSPTLKSPNQIQSLILQLTAISKFIPKLIELKHPIREAQTRMETAKEYGWTNETKEYQKETKQVTNIGHLKIRRRSNAMSTAKKRDNKFCATGRKERNPDTSRSLRTVFRKHKVKVVTDGCMEETLKLSGREGGLGKWATEIRIGIIMISLEEKMYSYVIRLKFKASNHAMDCEAPLAGIAVFTNQGMKDLHVFIDSLTLVTQVEGNHTPATKQEIRYKEEIIDAMVPFHRFRITHLLKILNLKAKVLTGLATIKLEFINHEVSIGIKTRPSIKETSSSKKGKVTSKALGAKPNCNHEASGSN
nr:reverse transcriptase domain-containing protein [Tanacetum cinerariifolium]